MTDTEYNEMAAMAIKRYLNSSDSVSTIQTTYALAIKRLVIKAKEIDTVRINGVKNYSSDGQVFAFNEKDPFEITEDIAILLPKKKFYAW